MQTFRKLPMIKPKRKKKKGITGLNLTHSREPLNVRRHAGCRMANLVERKRKNAEIAESSERNGSQFRNRKIQPFKKDEFREAR